MFSVVKLDVKFFYCDIYVLKFGLDVYGDGMLNVLYFML